MPPDAPPPRYDSHGNLVPAWKISIYYDPSCDDVVVWWSQEEGAYNSASRGTVTFGYDDVEDALEVVKRRVRIQSARRMF